MKINRLLVSKKELKLLGVPYSFQHIARLEKAGKFPKRVQLGACRVRVRGAALSGKAADGLQEASNIESRTLASLELSWKNGFNLLEVGDVLVIDEAGMVGTRQMSRFVKEAQRRGAKLILVGDPEQLQPINAGTPFRDIIEKIGHASLIEIHRQKENWQRQATCDFTQNRTDEALKAYADHGAVETLGNRSKAIAALVSAFVIATS